jgi:adenine-specific DNA glycosylase
MWEFPGVDASSPDDAIAVFRTAYTQNIRLTRRVFDYRHVFSHVVWHVEVWSGVLFAEGHGWTRVDSGRLSEYPIPSAFRPILDYIRVSSRQEHVA